MTTANKDNPGDLRGRWTGKLLVLALSLTPGAFGRRRWICICDACGSEVTIGEKTVLDGTGNCPSCQRRGR